MFISTFKLNRYNKFGQTPIDYRKFFSYLFIITDVFMQILFYSKNQCVSTSRFLFSFGFLLNKYVIILVARTVGFVYTILSNI